MMIVEICSVWSTYQRHSGGGGDFLGLLESAETTIETWIDQGWFRGWWEFNAYIMPPDFKSFVHELLEKHSGDA